MISGAVLNPIALPLARPWRTAHGVFQERLGWVLSIAASDGTEGYGEALPLPEAGTENHDDCHNALMQIVERLKEIDPEKALLDLPGWAPGSPAARCAAETALLGLLSKQSGLSPARWLNPRAADTVRVNAIAGSLSVGIENEIVERMGQGFTVIKVKVGLDDPASEARQLADLCRHLAPGVTLRLDANGAWEPEQAAVFLAGIDRLPIESLEEPLSHPDLALLKRFQGSVSFSLALDEHLWSIEHEDILANRPVDRIILKPMAAGGPYSCYKIGKKAQEAGLETVVTTTVDGLFGTQAALWAASALDEEKKWAHGLSTGSWFKENFPQIPCDSAEIRVF